jgi:hypothetical protein
VFLVLKLELGSDLLLLGGHSEVSWFMSILKQFFRNILKEKSLLVRELFGDL